MNEEEIEKTEEEIKSDNEKLLNGFWDWLTEKGLKTATKNKHCSNVDFYINWFLCNYESLEAKAGCYEVGRFLGDFFIRKAMWSTPNSTKSTATSIKKFYRYMLEVGKIDKSDYNFLCSTIKSDMPEWLKRMERYNDPDVEYEDYLEEFFLF